MSKLSLKIQNPEYKFKEKKSVKKIKQVSISNKNIAAKFSKEIKAAILIRDKHCIICNKPITDIHHVFFWTECEYLEDRNNVNKWVWLCRDHHNEVHWCKQLEWIRQECINYLLSIYAKDN